MVEGLLDTGADLFIKEKQDLEGIQGGINEGWQYVGVSGRTRLQKNIRTETGNTK